MLLLDATAEFGFVKYLVILHDFAVSLKALKRIYGRVCCGIDDD